MELLKSLSNTEDNNLILSLPNNRWTQSIQTHKGNKLKNIYKHYSLEKLLINNFDADNFNESDNFYYDQKKIEYSTNLDDKDYYNKFNYSKKFSIKLIQQGMYEKNQLSNIIFLSDLFKICLYIYNNNNLYKVSIKYDNNPLIVDFDKGWKINKNIDLKDYSIQKLKELNNLINFNISIPDNSYTIPHSFYKSSLNSINKYKLHDLIELAIKNGIEITENNKKKTKQKLYNELHQILI
tara:strand:+ start:60 stop:773 length:714 start_codon:yes stop_codon:yes gene_type:complete